LSVVSFISFDFMFFYHIKQKLGHAIFDGSFLMAVSRKGSLLATLIYQI